MTDGGQPQQPKAQQPTVAASASAGPPPPSGAPRANSAPQQPKAQQPTVAASASAGPPPPSGAPGVKIASLQSNRKQAAEQSQQPLEQPKKSTERLAGSSPPLDLEYHPKPENRPKQDNDLTKTTPPRIKTKSPLDWIEKQIPQPKNDGVPPNRTDATIDALKQRDSDERRTNQGTTSAPGEKSVETPSIPFGGPNKAGPTRGGAEPAPSLKRQAPASPKRRAPEQ